MASTASNVATTIQVNSSFSEDYRINGNGGADTIHVTGNQTDTFITVDGGAALDTIMKESGGLELLQHMDRCWPFFADLLDKIEMVCAKADLEIANLYLKELGAPSALVAEILTDFERTVKGLHAIRKRELLNDHRFLQVSLQLRNPYVDPLNLLQVSLLKKKRALPEGHADLRLLGDVIDRASRSLPADREVASQDVIVVQTPSAFVSLQGVPARPRGS